MEGFWTVEDWHNFGPDYDRTLMAWWDNFARAWPRLRQHYSDRFYRMWRYYLLAAPARSARESCNCGNGAVKGRHRVLHAGEVAG